MPWLLVFNEWILQKEYKKIYDKDSEVGESPSLKLFKKHVDVAQRDVVRGRGSDGPAVGLDDLDCFLNLCL